MKHTRMKTRSQIKSGCDQKIPKDCIARVRMILKKNNGKLAMKKEKVDSILHESIAFLKKNHDAATLYRSSPHEKNKILCVLCLEIYTPSTNPYKIERHDGDVGLCAQCSKKDIPYTISNRNYRKCFECILSTDQCSVCRRISCQWHGGMLDNCEQCKRSVCEDNCLEYCSRCEKEICPECATDDIHAEHKYEYKIYVCDPIHRHYYSDMVAMCKHHADIEPPSAESTKPICPPTRRDCVYWIEEYNPHYVWWQYKQNCTQEVWEELCVKVCEYINNYPDVDVYDAFSILI